MKGRSVPLGVDIGAARVRIAAAEQTAKGVFLKAVAARNLPEGSSSSGIIADPDLVAILAEEALLELGVRERRAICAIGLPDAVVRAVRFPPMTAYERTHAARFEARDFAPFDLSRATVQVCPIKDAGSLHAVGVTRADVLSSRVRALRRIGLRPIAIDHEAFALQRALPFANTVVDIGLSRAVVHTFGGPIPISSVHPSGGSGITQGIADDLSLKTHTAEERKRVIGTSGGGERARASLAAEIAQLVENARSHGLQVSRIAMVGNGARLAGLASDVEALTDAVVDLPIPAMEQEKYSGDVLRSAAPDWALAMGLCLWTVVTS